jgi:valyl-tRNA synthetase
VLDPDRKKMAKSKGNALTPVGLLDQHGTDAVRYWAASGRPGVDTAFDEGQMKVGRRLAIKVLNASKFVLSRLGQEGDVSAPLDRAMLANLADLVDDATAAFEGYDYARALERAESFFWNFCDDYLELVKGRAYGGQGDAGAESANRALTLALSSLLRLFAPFLPFVTEEVWSWWKDGSVHRATWPGADELREPAGPDADPLVLEVAAAVLGEVRKAKTTAKASMRAEVARAVVRDTPARLAALAGAAGDVRDAGRIAELVTEPLTGEGDSFSVDVELAEA